MSTRHDSQLSLPPVEVQRLDDRGESPTEAVQKVDLLAEIPLEMAKAQFGRAMRSSISRSGSPLKEFGDPSHVNRVCDGDIPSVIARIWSRADSRRELVVALAEESGVAEAETVIHVTGRKKMPA